MAKLLITLPDRGYITHELTGALVTVGRLSANTIQIDDGSVSGHHAQFAVVQGKYRLRDLNSLNKTWVNGAPISDAELTGSAILRFGTVEAVYQPDAGAQTADQLMLQLAEARRQVEKLKQARDAIHAQMQRSLSDLDEAHAVRDEAVSELDGLRVELQARREQTISSDREIARLVDETDAAQQTSGDLASDLASMRDDLENTQRELAAARRHAAEAGKAGNEAGELREQLTARQAEVVTITGEVQKARREAEEAKQRAANLEQESATRQAEVEAGRKEVEAANQQAGGAKEQIAALQNELEARRAELESARGQVSAGAEKVGALEQQAENLQRELAGRQVEIVAARQQIEEIVAEREAARRERGEAGARIAELEAGVVEAANLFQELDVLRAQLAAEAESAVHVKQQLAAAETARDEAAARVAGIEEERDRLAAEGEKSAVRIAELEAGDADAAELSRQMENFRGQLAEREAENEHSQQQLALVSAACDEAFARGVALEQERAEAGRLQAGADEHTAALRAELEAARAELGLALEAAETRQAELRSALENEEALRGQIDTLATELAANEQALAAVADERAATGQVTSELVAAREEIEALRSALEAGASQPPPMRLAELAAPGPARGAPSLFEPMEPGAHPEQDAAAVIASAPLLSSWLKRGGKKRHQQANGHAPVALEEPPVPAAIVELAVAPEPAAVMESVAAPEPPPLPEIEPLSVFDPAVAAHLDPEALASVPEILGKMRNALRYFVRHPEDEASLGEVAAQAARLTAQTQRSGYRVIHETSAALELLVRDLSGKPKRMNPSVLRTVSQTLDFITTLLEKKNLERSLGLPAARIFTVDDDPAIREMIIAAMHMVRLDAAGSGESRASLTTLTSEKVDLILLDVGMPEMNGLDLCTQLRALPAHAKTPIVFITGMATAQNRVQSTLRGGNDFIAKPFQVCELGLKALTWAFKGQLDLVS